MRIGVVKLLACGMGMLYTLEPLCSSGAPSTVAELADANRSAVEGIHSLILEVESKSQPAAIDRKYRFTWSGDRKRCQLQDFTRQPIKPQFSHREFRMGFTDAYSGPDGVRILMNYDPLEAVDLTVEIDHPAQGRISDVEPGIGTKNVVLQQEADFVLGVPDARGIAIPLWDFVAAANSCRVAMQPGDEGSEGCFVLEALVEKAEYKIQLSPDHNFMIKAIHCRNGGKNGGETWSNEVKQFTALGNGNYLGTSIESSLDEKLRISTTVKVISANSAIPEEDFRVVFPPGLRVNDQTKGKFYIWGEGEPRLTFRTLQEYRDWHTIHKLAWSAANSISIAGGQRSLRWVIVGLNVVVICLLVLIYLRRRKRRQQSASPTG